jgi:hypothetical protein
MKDTCSLSKIKIKEKEKEKRGDRRVKDIRQMSLGILNAYNIRVAFLFDL